ncbi:MAG: hypothetical protein ACOYM9_01875 [Bradymonadia bacterium]
MSGAPGEADDLDARRFLRRLGSVPDASMRVALWRESFESLEAERVLVRVRATLDALPSRGPDARLAYEALLLHLENQRGQPDEGRRALYEAARLSDQDEVCALLRSAPARRNATDGELRVEARDGDRDLSLGERRSIARSPLRGKLLRMLYDPDPGVIANLLGNPHLTENDVVRIAARRPVAAASLIAVFRHPRWGHRPAVRRALVYNPYTPGALATGLVALLDGQFLAELATEPSVSEAVRSRARTLLSKDADVSLTDLEASLVED